MKTQLIIVLSCLALAGTIYFHNQPAQVVKCHEDGKIILASEAVKIETQDGYGKKFDPLIYCPAHAPKCDFVRVHTFQPNGPEYFNNPKPFRVARDGEIVVPTVSVVQRIYTIERQTNYIVGPSTIYVTNTVEKPVDQWRYFSNLYVTNILLTGTNWGGHYITTSNQMPHWTNAIQIGPFTNRDGSIYVPFDEPLYRGDR